MSDDTRGERRVAATWVDDQTRARIESSAKLELRPVLLADAATNQSIDPSESPEMKELGEREIALALVDLECREKTSFTKKSMEIQFALEEKFIAANA